MTRTGVKVPWRFARVSGAIFGGVVGAYVAARVDVAIQGPCVPTADGSLACLPPTPNWVLVTTVGLLVAALAWLALSRVGRSETSPNRRDRQST